MQTSAKTLWKSTSIACASDWMAPARAFRRFGDSVICLIPTVPIETQPGGLIERLVPRGSLARHLVRRLMPAVLLLVMLDLGVTWIMTIKINLETWLLRDIFWVMVLSQCFLVLLFAWVLISGIRSELTRSEEHTFEL